MAEDQDARAKARERLRARKAVAGPAGPFLREYVPTGGFPQVSAQKASVLFYRNGGYSVVTVSGVRHVDKRALARPYTVCEIALGTYVTRLQMELPAAGGTTFFKAEVDIHWTVTDPHLAAIEVVTDVAQRLTAPVLERLREVSSAYRVTQAEQADLAITTECAGGRWAKLGTELGLRVRLYVRLRVDDRTIEHMDDIRDAHASAEVTRVHQSTFRDMLQGGELDRLSYMLAAEPEAAKDFLEKIRQEGRADEKERIDRASHPDHGARPTDGLGRTKTPKPTICPPAWVRSIPPPLPLTATGIASRQFRRPPPARMPPTTPTIGPIPPPSITTSTATCPCTTATSTNRPSRHPLRPRRTRESTGVSRSPASSLRNWPSRPHQGGKCPCTYKSSGAVSGMGGVCSCAPSSSLLTGPEY
ncbi:hypothetical protein [Streptomyces sp. NRRL S-1448]|uniref:hypothetical protein n=1 Tax=Streptomyces sp. NRRL S-1448 TaxID=1463883 RepID=UPI000AE87A4D|nr:hypothetical protein [Streptomyces sp. NRRL S-1448]